MSGNSAVLQAAFTAADPHSTQVVVQALMAAFAEHCAGDRPEPAANQSRVSKLANAEAALRQMELLEEQYLERMQQHELLVGTPESQEGRRRRVIRLQSEQQKLKRDIEQLQGRLGAARSAAESGRSADEVTRALAGKTIDALGKSATEGAGKAAGSVTGEPLRQLVATGRQQLVRLKSGTRVPGPAPAPKPQSRDATTGARILNVLEGRQITTRAVYVAPSGLSRILLLVSMGLHPWLSTVAASQLGTAVSSVSMGWHPWLSTAAASQLGTGGSQSRRDDSR